MTIYERLGEMKDASRGLECYLEGFSVTMVPEQREHFMELINSYLGDINYGLSVIKDEFEEIARTKVDEVEA